MPKSLRAAVPFGSPTSAGYATCVTRSGAAALKADSAASFGLIHDSTIRSRVPSFVSGLSMQNGSMIDWPVTAMETTHRNGSRSVITKSASGNT